MNLQYIHDTKGNTTGVFIPIEDWQSLKEKYSDLEEATDNEELPDWEKQLLDERLAEYYKNPETNLTNFDEMIDELRKNL